MAFGVKEESDTTSFELAKEEIVRNEERIVVSIQNQWLLGQKSHLAQYYPHLVPVAREQYLQYLEIYITEERKKLQAQYESGEITQDEMLDTMILDDHIRQKLAAGIE